MRRQRTRQRQQRQNCEKGQHNPLVGTQHGPLRDPADRDGGLGPSGSGVYVQCVYATTLDAATTMRLAAQYSLFGRYLAVRETLRVQARFGFTPSVNGNFEPGRT